MAVASFPDGITGQPSASLKFYPGVVTPTATVNLLDFSPTLNFTSGTPTINLLSVAPTITITSGATLAQLSAVRTAGTWTILSQPAAGTALQLFTAQHTVLLAGLGLNVGQQTLLDQSVIKANNLNVGTSGTYTSYDFNPLFIAAGPLGAFTVTDVYGARFRPRLQADTVGGSATISTLHNLRIEDAALTGAGTKSLPLQIGIDIATLAAATTNVSLQSAGAAVQMRHAGPGVFGANAAPTNTTSVALEVQSTTQAFLLSRLTTAQETTLATTAVNGMLIYNTSLNAVRAFISGAWATI